MPRAGGMQLCLTQPLASLRIKTTHRPQVHMLMHEFKLPSRVEAYAGRCKEGQQPDVSKAEWKFLGYVSFAPKPGGTARELKVIRVNAVGSFFRSGADARS